jgi:hypothetical protein
MELSRKDAKNAKEPINLCDFAALREISLCNILLTNTHFPTMSPEVETIRLRQSRADKPANEARITPPTRQRHHSFGVRSITCFFSSLNHTLTPHFHQFTVLDAEQTPSVSNPLPNNLLEWTGDSAAGATEIKMWPARLASEGANPDRSACSR